MDCHTANIPKHKILLKTVLSIIKIISIHFKCLTLSEAKTLNNLKTENGNVYQLSTNQISLTLIIFVSRPALEQEMTPRQEVYFYFNNHGISSIGHLTRFFKVHISLTFPHLHYLYNSIKIK